jgi:putative membrane protein
MRKPFSILMMGLMALFMVQVPSQAATINDGEIVAVVDTANAGEIAAGEYAQSRAKNRAVQDFAKLMVKDHTEMGQASKMLTSKLGLKPLENSTSRSLKEDNDKSMEDLKQQKDTDFDKAYIENQVKMHQKVLDIMDKELLPNAKNLELKHSLTNSRVKIAKHLAMAKKLQSNMD